METYFQPTVFNNHGSRQQIRYWRHSVRNWKAQRVKDPFAKGQRCLCSTKCQKNYINLLSCRVQRIKQENVHANKEQFASFCKSKSLKSTYNRFIAEWHPVKLFISGQIQDDQYPVLFNFVCINSTRILLIRKKCWLKVHLSLFHIVWGRQRSGYLRSGNWIVNLISVLNSPSISQAKVYSQSPVWMFQ